MSLQRCRYCKSDNPQDYNRHEWEQRESEVCIVRITSWPYTSSSASDQARDTYHRKCKECRTNVRYVCIHYLHHCRWQTRCSHDYYAGSDVDCYEVRQCCSGAPVRSERSRLMKSFCIRFDRLDLRMFYSPEMTLSYNS